METVYEAVSTTLNENRSEDLVSILAKNSSILPQFIYDNGKKFVADWEKMSNKVDPKWRPISGYATASGTSKMLTRFSKVLKAPSKKTGKKNDIFRNPKIEANTDGMVYDDGGQSSFDLSTKRVYYNNAAGNKVRVVREGASNWGTKYDDGLTDVYGLIHAINLYNLKYGFMRMANMNFHQEGSLFKGYKKKIKQWGMGEAAGDNSPAGKLMILSDVSGDSITISRMSRLDSVHGPEASWFKKQYNFENKDLTYMKTKTALIPVYTVHHISVGQGVKVPASEMVTRKISTVIKGSTTTLENSIAGVNRLFDQGKATISNAKLKAGLKVSIEKQLAQFDAITSIVVTGGASFEWAGGARNDENNKALAEKRAQYVANLIKEEHENLEVTTGGAAAAKIQPNENQDEVENWRKVYLKITGTVTGDDVKKDVSFEELESANWGKDKVAIDCYWIAVNLTNQNA